MKASKTKRVVEAAITWYFTHGPAYDYTPDAALRQSIEDLLRARGHTMRGQWCGRGGVLSGSCDACANLLGNRAYAAVVSL